MPSHLHTQCACLCTTLQEILATVNYNTQRHRRWAILQVRVDSEGSSTAWRGVYGGGGVALVAVLSTLLLHLLLDCLPRCFTIGVLPAFQDWAERFELKDCCICHQFPSVKYSPFLRRLPDVSLQLSAIPTDSKTDTPPIWQFHSFPYGYFLSEVEYIVTHESCCC